MKTNPIALTRAAFAGAAAFVLIASALATDYYATPAGAGAQNGSSWTDAYPQSQIQTAINSLQPGDTLNLGSGTYTLTGLTLSGSGAEGSPKSIVGVDTGGGRPLFQGTFNNANDAGGARFINFSGSVHYWALKNLAFRNHPWVINMSLNTSADDTLRSNLTFENLSFDSIEDAIRLYNVNHVTVTNCTAIRYTKKAFRVGDHTSFVTFTGCSADCTGGDPDFEAKAIPVGFGCDDTDQLPIIHDIQFIDCIAVRNGYPQSSSNYWNGDGFSSERGAYNITFLRCKAYDNHDGGFDNKASNVLYQDCVSVGNSRGFRHWADGGQMVNCVAAFNSKWGGTGASYGIWISGNGGELTVDLSTFHNNGTQLSVDSGGVLTVNNSILSTTSATAPFTAGTVTLNNTATWRPDSGTDPLYVAADSAWRGTPVDAMDSQTYGITKGYNSTRVDYTPNTPPTLAIAATPSSGLAPLNVQFTAEASDPDGTLVGFLWTFGDGQTSTLQNPTITYGSPGTFSVTCTVTDNRGGRATQSLTVTAEVPTTPVPVRIEAGSTSSYTDTSGNVWSADYGYGSGGGIADRGAIEIAGTDDDRLYQTERWGVSSYALLVANGTYNVRLHFAETYTGITAAGQRVFSVTAEDAAPAGWTNVDVFAETGGRNIALVKSGLIAVTDNVLNLAFTASANNAMVNAIEILPAAGGDMPPAPPTGLAASDITANSFTLSWSPGSDDVGVAGYDVFRNGVFVGSTSGTSLAVTGLAPYTSYNMTVRTLDTVGNGSIPSAPLAVKTLNDGTVGNEIIIDNADPFGVAITGAWTASTFTTGYYGSNYLHDGNTGKGTKSVRFTPDVPTAGTYTVYLQWTSDDGRASNVPVDITHAGGTTTVTVNQRLNGGAWYSVGTYALAAGTANNVLIRTTGTNGHVIADAVRFLRQGADGEPPSVPTGLAASGITSEAFSVSWTASTDNTGVTGYEVFLDGVAFTTTAGTTANITGLAPDTTYEVAVRALDAAGNASGLSAPLSVTTEQLIVDTEPPSPPSGLAASGITSTSFTLSWTASTDNVGVTGYEVFLDGTSRATPAGTSATLTGLSPETTYSATVRALDAAGNASPQSTALSVTTATSSGGGGTGAVISVNLGDTANSLAPTDVVGAVPAANWSNSTTNNQTLTNVVDNTGTPTTADVSLASTAFAYNNNTPVLADPLTDDAKMMRSQRALSNGSTMFVSAAQVPYAVYDVYVYWGGRISSETVPATMTVNFQSWNGSSWVTSATGFIRDANRSWDGTYDESTATTAADAVDGQEYVVFRNVTEATFRVAATTGVRTGICGIQIVERVPSGPAAPVITSTLSAAGTYGQTFAYQIAATESPSSYGATGLPAGLALDSVSGAISGTPATAGSYAVELSATNAGGTGTASLALEIAPAPAGLALARLWQLYDGQPKPVAVVSTPEDVAVEITYNGSDTPPVYPGSYDVAAMVTDPNYTGAVTDTLVIATTALVRHAPVINGEVDGSVHVLLPESLALNTAAAVSGDLLLPGTPGVQPNGQPVLAGVIDGPGNAEPATYAVTLNHGAVLRYVVRRIDAVAMPVVAAPPATGGTRDVVLNSANDATGDFTTLRNLTLNSGAGERAIPAGTYGWFTVNASTRLVLGVAGATEPAVYDLQGLTLNGGEVQILGPVVLTLASGTSLNGSVGAAASPESLLLRVAAGDLTLNTGAALHGFVEAPAGTVTINSGVTLYGGVASDRLIINGGTLTSAAP